MAQTGYTPISLYYSTTGGVSPTAGNLANGELAINITDGKLFYKDNGGVVQTIASKAVTSTAVTSVSVASSNGLAGTSSGGTTPTLTLSTTVTGLLKGNGTAISAAVSGTDYAPATSGTSILYGNGSGGFSNVTVGSGLTFSAGTLTATGSGGTVTSVSVTSANGFAGSVLNPSTTPAITISTSVTGLLKGNGTAVSAAVAKTDYAPATTGTNTQLLANDGSGGFNNVTVGTGLSYSAGTLSATNAGTVTSVTASAPLASSGGATPNISFTGTLAVANGGTGQTTYTDGQLLIGNTATTGLSKATLTAGTGISITNGNGSISIAATSSGATITNDTSTATNVYPVFANATSGSLSTAYTSNANLLYKPSTGEFQASELIASNGLVLNNTTVNNSYTVATGNNAMSIGPITVASGKSVTVSSGQRWVVL